MTRAGKNVEFAGKSGEIGLNRVRRRQNVQLLLRRKNHSLDKCSI